MCDLKLFIMACHPDIQADEFDPDLDDLTRYTIPHSSTSDLERQVQSLHAEVDRLRECLQDSLDLQCRMLEHLEESGN